MNKARTAIGLIFIAAAVAGLIFWEVKGRDTLLLDTVIVASETIPAGTVITRDVLSTAGILEENRIQGAFDLDTLSQCIGQRTIQDIIKNSQISEEYLTDDDFYLRDKQSIFVIQPDWIAMRSSSIRRGDWIDIYEGDTHEKVGTCRVAFVKDINEIEVTNGDEGGKSNSLDRTVSTSPISHIEIISDIQEYKRILNSVRNNVEGLLLVQKQVIKK